MAVEQLQHIIHREPWATWLRPGGCLESAHCELNDLLSSVIAADRARRAAPPAEGETEELAAMRRQVVPVPVSERLPNLSPQGGDFNDAGLLWWFIPKLGWRMCSRDAVDCIPYPTHWLPFHALPLPSREVGND